MTNELERPTLRRINVTLSGAFSFVTLLYGVVGLFAYFSFGSATRTNVLLNYPDGDAPIIAVRIGLSVAVAFSYPVLAAPWKESCASLLFGVDKLGKNAADLPAHKYALLVLCLVALSLSVAMLTDDLGIVSKVQGATAGTFLQIIAPGIIYYYYAQINDERINDTPMHSLKLKGAVLLIAFGMLMIPLATTMIFIDT